MLISSIYHRKSSKDQKRLSEKLSEEVKAMILESKKDNLTVEELNELIHEKTIDPKSEDIFPYKACPNCGSENIKRYGDGFAEFNGSMEIFTPYEVVECEECEWKRTEMDP